ncbi:rRNA methyltransferase [Brachybacterium alimentarium]|uniref:TrmH family RNA methyltransferase n=1 Tax=Brachybacterium alimentarium TaxID=47845 RepID=UPI000DF2643C|nr:TrmH family RNA methyltransferase [Brachybacterium alimentarium]RCS91118.1 rRNA methyltransferase [Brachybacterium alimentarium]
MTPSAADPSRTNEIPDTSETSKTSKTSKIPETSEKLVTSEAPERAVGVGPHPLPWPEGEHWDPELLQHGDRRNVEDRFRYWRREAIVTELDAHRHDLHVAIENLEHDANIGSVVRTANAFGVGAFHIVGRRRWNRRGAMVTDRYQHEIHHPDAADLIAWAREQSRPIVAIDLVPGAMPLEHTTLPRNALLVVGQEGPGVSAEILAAADLVVGITQFGSTRSINVAAAAAIAMHSWILQHAEIPDGPVR